MKKYNPKVDLINGFLLVDKPAGLTSHDVVDRVRRTFQLKKVGHAGTLDPLATGLLVLALGKATKLTGQLIVEQKGYEAVCLLGKESDTQDIQGKILNEGPTESLTDEAVKEVVLSFLGEQCQIPPMFSAKKQKGKKLYELARQGIEVEREPKAIEIYEINIKEMSLPQFKFDVLCSKGTYVRTLCHDIGRKLGCGGLLFGLRRISSGSFELSEALTLDEVLTKETDVLQSLLIPMSEIKNHESTQSV